MGGSMYAVRCGRTTQGAPTGKPRGYAACNTSRLLDDFRCLKQQGRRNFEAEGSGGLEIDAELEFRGLLDRQISGLRALQNFVHVGGSVSPGLTSPGPVRHQSAVAHKIR